MIGLFCIQITFFIVKYRDMNPVRDESVMYTTYKSKAKQSRNYFIEDIKDYGSVLKINGIIYYKH